MAGDAVAGSAAGDAVAGSAAANATTMVLDPVLAADAADPGSAKAGEHYDSEEADDTDWPKERFSKLAIVALLTSLAALLPLAVGFGIAALVGIRRSGRRGHGMAMAALFICAAWVIVAGAVGTVGELTHGFHKPVKIRYTEAAIFKLREGECVNIPNGQLVSVLPCSTPHQAEVFATFSLPASAWPGSVAVKQEASAGCGARLIGYINPQLGISLAQDYVFPTQVDWTAGTRTVICEVRAATGELTGSVRGAS
jgi:Septum formation